MEHVLSVVALVVALSCVPKAPPSSPCLEATWLAERSWETMFAQFMAESGAQYPECDRRVTATVPPGEPTGSALVECMGRPAFERSLRAGNVVAELRDAETHEQAREALLAAQALVESDPTAYGEARGATVAAMAACQ